MEKTSVKEKLIATTIKLIENNESIEDVTVRDIAAAAEVGTGLINYHFQTKDNLIKICVERIIGDVIQNFDRIYKSLTMAPLEKLRFLTKRMCTFLIQNPGISRVSILSDLFSGSNADNSVTTIHAYRPVVREVCGPDKSDKEIYLLTQILTATIQSVFLRADVLKENTDIDFNNTEQRDELIDFLIDSIFNSINTA